MIRLMVANVVGRSQHADRRVLATQPYAAGGAQIKRTSDCCGGRRYGPKQRLGEDAGPYTAGGLTVSRPDSRPAGRHGGVTRRPRTSGRAGTPCLPTTAGSSGRPNTARDANHAHPVWRDPEADFGTDALAEHRHAHHGG